MFGTRIAVFGYVRVKARLDDQPSNGCVARKFWNMPPHQQSAGVYRVTVGVSRGSGLILKVRPLGGDPQCAQFSLSFLSSSTLRLMPRFLFRLRLSSKLALLLNPTSANRRRWYRIMLV